MKLSHAIEQAKKSGQRNKVTQGKFKPNGDVEIHVQPARDLQETNEYLKSLRLSKLSSEPSDDQFAIQVAETGDTTMTDVDENLDTDVFDEGVFTDKKEATEWIERSGYF